MGKKRLNIGLLINEYCELFAKEVSVGAMYAAEEMDANLFILSGGYFNAPYMERDKSKYEYQNNYMYNFALKENIDVLIVLLGTIASNVDKTAQKKFLERYDGIPIITIANKIDGYPNISFDNKAGFAREIEYLVEHLGKRKIGIVCGPPTNHDSIERLEAYKEVLTKNNIEIDDKKIVYGNFTEYSDDVVTTLLDNNPDLDAIVFSNDYMALGGYRVMEKRGIKVGRDIVVVGFDDWPFSALMEPGLATTRAASSELGYRAVKEACFLKPGDSRDVRIETTFIVRESCGEKEKDALAKAEKTFVFNPEKEGASVLVEHLRSILFEGYTEESVISMVETELEAFIDWMIKKVYGKSIDDELLEQISENFIRLNTEIFMRADHINVVYEISEYLIALFAKSVKEDTDRIKLYKALADCYKNILMLNERHRNRNVREQDVLNKVTMSITRDMLNDDEVADNYSALLTRMHELDFKKSYIMMFPKVIKCHKNGKWDMPDKLLLKAYQKGKNSYLVSPEDQEISVKDMFNVPLLEDGKRKTFALSILFSKDEQYGIYAVEPNQDNLASIEPVAFQISSAIETIQLICSKIDMSAQLAESLEQLKETNAFLDEVSKSDELTQIYNRRGFLVTAQRVMKEVHNRNRRAVIIYADMNNLKLINDKFGHEEGDYALKSIARILKDALGENEIIGRFGGDEFAAFLFTEDKNYEQVLRTKITDATVRLNAGNDKPYYISMSAGMSSFVNEEDAVLNDAMVRADVDLYLQKKHKRNRILK